MENGARKHIQTHHARSLVHAEDEDEDEEELVASLGLVITKYIRQRQEPRIAISSLTIGFFSSVQSLGRPHASA